MPRARITPPLVVAVAGYSRSSGGTFTLGYQFCAKPRWYSQSLSRFELDRHAAATSGYPLGAGQSSGVLPMLCVVQCRVFRVSARSGPGTPPSVLIVAIKFSVGLRTFFCREAQ